MFSVIDDIQHVQKRRMNTVCIVIYRMGGLRFVGGGLRVIGGG